MRRSILMACALLGALATLAGCASATATAPHPAPTATSVPTTSLSWREVAMPSGVSLKDNTYLSAAPSPAHVVWACVALSRQQFAIWALRAPGGTWQHSGMISPSVPPLDGRCVPIADQIDPHTLAVVFSTVADGDVAYGTTSYISTDDGAHWQQVGDKIAVTEMAEVGGHTIAVLSDTSVPPGTAGLVISRDHLRTWTNVGMPQAEASQITRFWLNSTGEMLAGTRNFLWRSSNSGMTWVHAPGYSFGADYVVWLPSAHIWRMCHETGVMSGEISCTDDLGKSWEQSPQVGLQTCQFNFMTANGDAFMYCPTATGQKGWLMTLPLIARQWVDLGPAPGLVLAAWDDGTLWSLDGQAGNLYTTTLTA
ncbi:MAG TPA: hypothetical protein VF807_03735 [Ktedonobacterales bacterium]